MSNQLLYYTFTIIKNFPNETTGISETSKETITYTSRSPTLARLKAEKYAKQINGKLQPKYTTSPTPTKPDDPNLKKLIQGAFFG